MKLYRLNVTAHGEPSAIFALAEDVDSLLQALEYQGDRNRRCWSLQPPRAFYDNARTTPKIRS